MGVLKAYCNMLFCSQVQAGLPDYQADLEAEDGSIKACSRII